MKICTKCFRSDVPFGKHKKGKFGLRARCRQCERDYGKAYHHANRPKELARQAKWRKNNPDRERLRYLANPQRAKDVSQYRRKHKKEEVRAAALRLKAKNPKRQGEYMRKRRAEDIEFRLADALRGRLYQALKRGAKAGSAVSDLGCTISELRVRLEALFHPNPQTGEQMTWENRGRYGWHIDHIKPLAKFDLTDRAQFLEACHYTNLQPLWAIDNLKKRDKYLEEVHA